MKITAQLTFDKVRYDQDNDLHLVVSAKAPRLNWQENRSAILVIPVIDISGSMGGDKLHYAKQSAMKLVDHLQPGDFCGIAAFGSAVHEIAPPREITQAQKDKLKGLIGNLNTEGCTNFSGGLLKGLEWANKADLPKDIQIRVIMFTDGHANEGVATELTGLTKVLKAHQGRATVSCFGYGEGADQELLASLAKVGGGNYAFVKDPEDALAAFAKELGGLLSTYAQDVVIRVKPHNGHTIEEVLTDVDTEEKGKTAIMKLPNLLSEEEMHFTMAVRLSAQTKAFPRKMNAFDIEVSYRRLTDEGTFEDATEKLKAKVRYVTSGKEQTEPTKEVDEIVSLAQLVQAQIKAEEQANQGNYQGAVLVMNNMASVLRGRGHEGHANMAMAVGNKMSGATLYASSSGYRTSARRAVTRSKGGSYSPELEMDFAANLGESYVSNMSNDAQESMTESFTGPTTSNDFSWPDGPVQVTNDVVSNQPDQKIKVVSTPKPRTPKNISKSKSKRW